MKRLVLLVAACTTSQASSPAPPLESPVITRIAGTADVTVTFRAREPVAIESQLCGRAPCVDRLLPVGGGIYARELRVRGDLRVTYRIVRDGTPIATAELVLPDAPPQPWTAVRAGVAHGQVSELAVAGRTAWVYAPPGHDARRTYPMLICFDGEMFTAEIPAPTILDNLIAARRVPPLVAVFVGQRPAPERTRELSNNAAFLAYLTDQLLPAVRARWAATSDPRQTAVCGASTGGLASAFAALRRSDVFGNVISLSGAYWRGDSYDSNEREWLTARYAATPRLPVRFVVQVGILERWSTPGNGPSMLDTNRRLRAVLEQKGYELHYHEVASGHDPASWRGGLADGLVELFGISSE